MKTIVAILLLSFFVYGCAAPPRIEDQHAADYKSDLATRLDVSVDYVSNDRRALCLVNISNPRAYNVRVWLVVETATDGQRLVSARRFYAGNDTTLSQTFKLQPPGPGIEEKIHIEAFNDKGELLLKTEPIDTTKGGEHA